MLYRMNNVQNSLRERVIYAFQEERPVKPKEDWSWSLMAGTILVQLTAPSIWVSYGVISLYFLRYEPFSWHNYWTPVVYTMTWILSEPWFEQLCERIENSVEFMYVSIVGTLLGWIGLMLVVITPLTQSHLVGLVGFLGGLGTSMCTASTETLLKKHFPLRQGVIKIVLQLLFALSMFCMPVFSFFIMEFYGRHGGLLLHSGIIMQGLIGAVLLKVKKLEKFTNVEAHTMRTVHMKNTGDGIMIEELASVQQEFNEMRNWRNAGLTPLTLGSPPPASPPAPPNTPDVSPYTTFNSYSNNFHLTDSRNKPLVVLKGTKIYTGKDYRKHKLTNLFGVEILPEISEDVEDVDNTSEEGASVISKSRSSLDKETARVVPNSIPKPARTYIKLNQTKTQVEERDKLTTMYYELEHKLCANNEQDKNYDDVFVSEDHIVDDRDVEAAHTVDEHCELVSQELQEMEYVVSNNGNVKSFDDDDDDMKNYNLNKKELKAQKAQRFYSRLVYASTTTAAIPTGTVDNLSYTSDKFLHWQGRRSVLGGLRSNCSVCCSSNCRLARIVDSDLLAILTTPSFIPVLFLLFTQMFSMMVFVTFVTHLVSKHIRDTTLEECSFSVSLSGFMFLCFTIASPCFSTISRRYHQIICVVALYLMSFSFYMLSHTSTLDGMTLLCCLYGVCHGIIRMTSQTIVKSTFGHGRLHKTKSVFNPLIAFLLILFSVLIGVTTHTDHYSNIFIMISLVQLIVGVVWSFKTCIRLSLNCHNNRST